MFYYKIKVNIFLIDAFFLTLMLISQNYELETRYLETKGRPRIITRWEKKKKGSVL